MIVYRIAVGGLQTCLKTVLLAAVSWHAGGRDVSWGHWTLMSKSAIYNTGNISRGGDMTATRR